ncbi:RidA family protein [Haloferacaceae archaeon DSL9]
MRHRVSSGTAWESRVGYSRAVRVDDHVHVSGTTATDEGGALVGSSDAAAQARRALENIELALGEAGAAVGDVVRTRIYVVDIDDWETIGDVHAEWFGDVRPATSMVEVSRLVDPDLLVEIEATAIVERE